MSKLIFKEIGCENFHSFKKLVFPIQVGKHLITGHNGSGKSSIFEIIPWVFYKSSLRGKNPSLNYKGNLMAYVEFYKNNSLYRIERYLNHVQYDNALRIFKDNEDLSRRVKTSSEKELQNIIGITEDLFNSTVVVLQGLPVNFSNLTGTTRKALLEEILRFSLWEELKKKINLTLEEKKKEKSDKISVFQKNKELMVSLNSKLESLKNFREETSNELNSKIFLLKKKIEEALEEKTTLEYKKDNLLKEIKAVSIQDARQKSLNYEKLIWQNQNKINSLNKILEDGICPECGQNYPEEKIKIKKDELIFLERKNENISKLKEKIKEVLLSLEEKSLKISNISASIQTLEKELFFTISELKKKRGLGDITTLEEQLNEFVTTVNGLQEELNILDKEISNLEYLESILRPSSKFRSFVLKNFLLRINNILSTISPLFFDNLKVEIVLDGRDIGIGINITKDGFPFEYRSLSGGQKRRLDIAIIIALQKFFIENSGISTNLIVFDEIFDSLDEQSTNLVINVINLLFPENICAYIITHNDKIKNLFDSLIKVEKVENISLIS